MLKIYSTEQNKFLEEVNKIEAEVQRFISENWENIFPHLTFIKTEFPLEGIVRSDGRSGRIDILAFNRKTKKIVIIELKRNSDRNIGSQATDYRDSVEDNFPDIYYVITQEFDIALPKLKELSRNSIELILIAKSFSPTDIKRADKNKGEITLIKYLWFENQLFLFEYLNNAPDGLNEKKNSVKLAKSKNTNRNKSKSANLEKPSPDATGDRDSLLLYFKPHGKCKKTSEGFLVLAGSKVREMSECCPPETKRQREENASKIGTDGTLLQDILLPTSSAAAKFLAGCSINGKKAWKTASGKTLNEIMGE